MARKARIAIDNNYVHVLTVGLDNIKPYLDNAMKDYYLNCMALSCRKYNIIIIAYAIMDCHSHLLLKVADTDTLSRYMTFLNATFARHYNLTTGHEGKIFKDRFKAEIVDGRVSICNCIRFIQGDPLRMQVASLDNYPYTSYYDYQKGTTLIDLTDAGRHFNTSPRAVASMMSKPSDEPFYDSIQRQKNKDDEVFGYVISRCNITTEEDLNNDRKLAQVAHAIRELTHMSMAEMSEQLGVTQERIKSLLVD